MIANRLHTDQEVYRLLVESIKDYAIFLLDTNGHIISWNKGAEQLKGYKANEVVGEHIAKCYTGEDVAKGIPERNLRKAREMGHFEEEGWRVRKDGSLFWANVVITALNDEKGNFIGFSKVTRDLTNKRKAEEEIRKLNLELEHLNRELESEISAYKHALDEAAIVAITNQKGIITYVNDNFCKISKYSKEELLGKDHRLINSGYHPKEFIRNLWVTITQGKIWRGELKNKAKDGTYYWVETTIVPFLDAGGKPYQYVAIRGDITQRKQAEEEILKINESLEHKIKERTYELTLALEREKELSEMKSRFVSMASHEFRTPLSAILSSIALVDHYTAPEQNEKRKKHIERIKSSVKNLTDILDEFLSLDKLEQGRVMVMSTGFNLQELIQDTIEEMDGMLKKKYQKIQFVYTGQPMVHLDKKILRNVLLNLLSNSVKYSPEAKTIHLTADVNDQTISVSIRDEGIGIPPEAQKHLFSKFYRADNAANIQGTGLGLNIVKKYIELLDGDIHFVSKENEGSTFTIHFPRIKD